MEPSSELTKRSNLRWRRRHAWKRDNLGSDGGVIGKLTTSVALELCSDFTAARSGRCRARIVLEMRRQGEMNVEVSGLKDERSG